MQVRADPAPSVTRELRRRDWKSLVFVVLGIALVTALAWWLTQSAGRKDERAGAEGGPGAGGPGPGGPGAPGGGRRAPVVGLATVALGDVPVIRSALGTVTPLATIEIRPQASGQVTAIRFNEGQLVRRGQLLAEIDVRAPQAALEQARATVAQSEALLANSRVDLQRFQLLLKQDSIAEQQVTNQQALVRQQVAQVAANAAAVRAAEVNVAFTRVLAPVSGRVGLRQVDVGNYVTTGQATPITTLTQIAPIDVSFALPEDQVPAVAEKFRRGEPLEAALWDRGRTRVLATGRLFSLNNQVDPQTGTLTAKARVTNADGALIPNQFVNVDLTVDRLEQVPVAPAAAFRAGPQGTFTYVVGANSKAEVRRVQLGPAVEDKVAVLSGLRPGERIVTEGGDRLTDGATVRLPGQRPPGARNGRGEGRRPRG